MTDLKTIWNTLNHKDVWVRALKTGVVVFIVTLGGSLANLASLPSISDFEKLAFSALCAAGTAILNYAIQLKTPQIQQP